jgi:hypothetical protein
MDRRVDILNSEYHKWTEDKAIQSIYPNNFPLAYRDVAINAMDENGRQMCMEFIEYVVKNTTGHHIDEKGNVEFKFKGEWIDKETLFENFI